MRVKLYSDSNRASDLKRVTDFLQDNKLVVFPTDLRYVVGCDALKNAAIDRLVELKGVPESRSRLTMLCSSLGQISEYARVENWAFKLMKKNLPGEFTFILPGLNRLPKVFDKRKEVGVRIPENPILMQIVEALGHPILVSSLPEKEGDDVAYFLNPELVDERFGYDVGLVVDGGLGKNGVTTVVDCTGSAPAMERQGNGKLII